MYFGLFVIREIHSADRKFDFKNKASELELLTFFCCKRQIYYLNCNVIENSR
jgi:hypothetical protein